MNTPMPRHLEKQVEEKVIERAKPLEKTAPMIHGCVVESYKEGASFAYGLVMQEAEKLAEALEFYQQHVSATLWFGDKSYEADFFEPRRLAIDTLAEWNSFLRCGNERP